nr:MAG TPA: hypothetical protein [Caudoviricetes sp.]
MTIVFEGFLGFCPGSKAAFNVTKSGFFRCLDELENHSCESAPPSNVGNENLVLILNDRSVGGGNCKLQVFDGGEVHVRASLNAHHADGRNLGPFVGHPIGVVCVDLGNARHLEPLLVEGCEGGNQAGEGAADRELGDAVLAEGFCDGLYILVPNDLGEVDEVVACIDALAVGPECSGVDALGADVLDLVGDCVLKSGNFLHGVFLRLFCCECILPSLARYIQSIRRYKLHNLWGEKVCILQLVTPLQ